MNFKENGIDVYVPMRSREMTVAALTFCAASLTSTSTSTVSSVANNLVVELGTEAFELMLPPLSTRSSGELSSGASPMVREP
jgi:hypothetical protein